MSDIFSVSGVSNTSCFFLTVHTSTHYWHFFFTSFPKPGKLLPRAFSGRVWEPSLVWWLQAPFLLEKKVLRQMKQGPDSANDSFLYSTFCKENYHLGNIQWPTFLWICEDFIEHQCNSPWESILSLCLVNIRRNQEIWSQGIFHMREVSKSHSITVNAALISEISRSLLLHSWCGHKMVSRDP